MKPSVKNVSTAMSLKTAASEVADTMTAAGTERETVESAAPFTGRRALLSALVCGAALPWLAACASRPAPPRSLDLGPAPTWRGPAPLPRRVDVQAVSASELMQGFAVVYRLDYTDPYTRRAYRDSRWAAPVPTLVAGRLKQLASRAELAPGADSAPPVSLVVDLEDFVQRFSSATQSEITLRLSATLITAKALTGAGPRKTFEGSAPAGGDADGAVRAIAQLLDRIGAEMLAWAAATGLDATPARR
ncbi:cholesterol transport system auxiliary component [Roseateles sp. YR242]|uniref:ABC-type transport auxiliary lipoprotein family protein n=1 Tax=Roseateles sp. YR242 TaxID=1855305 RepID=UPI0008C89D2B|nr:ABC-type transport auxiliary lipoprotein family protein [Roseateles sp. YR242]SEL01326.1 cholesterol transport system auxiliary component [Roseateles sp. YR242]